MIYDYYRIDRQMDPGPAETFVAGWRLFVAEHTGYPDAVVGFARDGYGVASFRYTADQVATTGEAWSYPVAPGQYHTYRFESSDMLHYKFWIDQQLVHEGLWYLNVFSRSMAVFGDNGQGGGTTSLTKWDNVYFGVVPEPGAALAVLALLLVARRLAAPRRPKLDRLLLVNPALRIRGCVRRASGALRRGER